MHAYTRKNFDRWGYKQLKYRLLNLGPTSQQVLMQVTKEFLNINLINEYEKDEMPREELIIYARCMFWLTDLIMQAEFEMKKNVLITYVRLNGYPARPSRSLDDKVFRNLDHDKFKKIAPTPVFYDELNPKKEVFLAFNKAQRF